MYCNSNKSNDVHLKKKIDFSIKLQTSVSSILHLNIKTLLGRFKYVHTYIVNAYLFVFKRAPVTMKLGELRIMWKLQIRKLLLCINSS